MASKFVVLVVFAAVVQASLAAPSKASSDVHAAKKSTLKAWNGAVDFVFYSIANTALPLDVGRAEYLSLDLEGGRPYVEVTSNSKKDEQLELDRLTARYLDVTGIVFKAIAAARKSKNLAETNKEIDNYQKQLPLERGSKGYHCLATSHDSQTEALAALETIFDNYFLAIKSLAAKISGEKSSTDTSSKDKALEAIKKYVDVVYGCL